MTAHEPPCETWQEHIAVALDAGEADRPADFLDRFDSEREEEERAQAAADMASEELVEAWA